VRSEDEEVRTDALHDDLRVGLLREREVPRQLTGGIPRRDGVAAVLPGEDHSVSADRECPRVLPPLDPGADVPVRAAGWSARRGRRRELEDRLAFEHLRARRYDASSRVHHAPVAARRLPIGKALTPYLVAARRERDRGTALGLHGFRLPGDLRDVELRTVAVLPHQNEHTARHLHAADTLRLRRGMPRKGTEHRSLRVCVVVADGDVGDHERIAEAIDVGDSRAGALDDQALALADGERPVQRLLEIEPTVAEWQSIVAGMRGVDGDERDEIRLREDASDGRREVALVGGSGAVRVARPSRLARLRDVALLRLLGDEPTLFFRGELG